MNSLNTPLHRLVNICVKLLLLGGIQAASATTPVFINEIHYDNAGTDSNEAIEIAGPSGIDLSGWSLVLYNGNGGFVYDTVALAGTLPDLNGGFGISSVLSPGLQNGAPDGIALVDSSGTVIQFLSYEGTFTATDGPALGLASTDIGIAEGSATPIDHSLQLIGTGSVYEDFVWTGPQASTFGTFNTGQFFSGTGPTPTSIVINEIMQNPSAVSDAAGEWFELFNATDTDIDINGWTIRDDDSDTHTISNGGPLTVPAGGYIVLGVDAETATNGGVSVDYAYGSSWFLANGDDEVVLIDTSGTEIDRVAYDNGATFPDPIGASMALADPALDNADGANWCESSTPFGAGDSGTPGSSNDCPVPMPVVTIMEIQGSGQFSPYDGTVVETTGVVTLVSANGRNMWIQDTAGDADPSTSDGILVSDRHTLSPQPEVGDLITIKGAVDELQFTPSLPLTRIDNPESVAILSSGNPLPVPIPLIDLPNEQTTDGIDFWEPLEGMLVSVTSAPVVAATSRFGEFAMLASTDAVPGSGYFPSVAQILIRSLGGDVVDYNPERIVVDDASLDGPVVVRPGDLVNNLVGVVDYTFGNYKLQPVPGSTDVTVHPMPIAPVSVRSSGGTSVDTVITTYNVDNLFDLIANPDKDDAASSPTPEQLETKLGKLAKSIELELETPSVLVVQGVENQAILQELGDRVNATAGTMYVATSFETSDARGIEVGFLWDSARVNLMEAFQITEAIIPGTDAAFGPSSPSPGREPLVGIFNIDGNMVMVVGNHFKSKGGDDPIYGINQPPIRLTEVQRKAQAQVVRDFVDSILGSDPDALVMVTGDLSDFSFAEPGEGTDHPVAIIEGIGGGVPLTDLVSFETEAEQWSFVFDGNSQVLDHMLISPELLARATGADFLHANTPFPSNLRDDDSTPIGASDQDPLEGRFCLDNIAPVLEVSATPDTLWPSNHKYVDVTVTVNVSDADAAVFLMSVMSSEPDDDGGDGATINDIVIADERSFKLRAERSAMGDGRIYTITYQAIDPCGNTTVATAEVTVPKNRR